MNLSLSDPKNRSACSGDCHHCAQVEAEDALGPEDPQGIRLALWSFLVFLAPLILSVVCAIGARRLGPSAGAAGGVLGLLAGAVGARFLYLKIRSIRNRKAIIL